MLRSVRMELLYYPDPKLRRIAGRVKSVNGEVHDLVRPMFDVMYGTRGIGLAAPQVGLDIRMIVANLTCDPERADREEVYLNPQVVEREGEVKEEEACLSLPGLYAELARPKRVTVRYMNLEGRMVTRTVEDLHARLFEHEIDHLDGILIVDRLSAADKAKWAPLLKELEADFKGGKKRRRAPAPSGL